jgi:hypothetical protein
MPSRLIHKGSQAESARLYQAASTTSKLPATHQFNSLGGCSSLALHADCNVRVKMAISRLKRKFQTLNKLYTNSYKKSKFNEKFKV